MMNDRSLDALSIWLGKEGRSRRTVLRQLLAGCFGIGTLALGVPTGGAAAPAPCRGSGRPCRRERQCCSGRCVGQRGKRRCRGRGRLQPRPLPQVPAPQPPAAGVCHQGESFCRDASAATCGDGCDCFQAVTGLGFCGRFRRGAVCRQDADCVALGLPDNAVCAVNDGPVCEIETATLCAVTCPVPTD